MQLESSAKIQTFLLQTTFSLSGLNIPNYTSDSVGSAVTSVNVDQTLGLNALGISLFRMNDAPSGRLNPAHIHPRGTEIFVVLEAELNVGFATSNPNNRLVSKTLYPGDVFVFAVGIIHFQRNVGKTKAVAFAGLRSQNPGVITIPNAVSGSNPAINTDVLTTEIFVVLEAKLNVGFVTSNPNNRLVSKTLDPGDVFVFPVGIIHFQRNVGKTKAAAFAGLSSQNPGVITIPNAVSGSNPAINTDVLTKAFQLIKKVVKYLQSRF